MKYQRLASLGLAALSVSGSVSASPLIRHEGESVCPSGYTQSVYYVTVTASSTPAPTSSVEPTTTVESSSTVTETTVITPEIPVQSSTYTPVETAAPAETPAPVETSAPVELTTSSSTTEAPVVAPTAATPSTTVDAQPTEVVAQPSTPSSSTEEPAETPIVAKTPSTTADVQPTTAAAAPTTKQLKQSTTSTAAPAASTTSSSTGSSSGSSSASNSGEATFYGGNLSGGACSFSGYTLPSTLFGTALGSPRWDNAAECGACVAVTGPNGNTIKAMIVDKCPECDSNHLDLFQSAFTELADISKGVIDITWDYVSCDIDTPLKLKNKEGTSAYWFSMQVVNANEAVTSLEVSTDGGSTWQSTTRSDYNYFENSSGFGTETVDVRVTGKSGKVVTVTDVSVSSGVEVTAGGNV
ncbi:RlpA-like double-psi beta-barrel-protein domain-containing protein-containing protein [Aspergillus pseudocaelatus]|uniref:RlpA-like double-psi beta-barrel-protein domain-containing protein-containing protein n=1 Tax=Aspergillus pseudocaelatus TaxID=1825620 RepID=A0ABQ6X1K3_9EURO|nr:RlpA-like double-psi beta-barrel-protein domain-containing protein-containing protein [Aspergillus pseudocaelatus]